MWIFVSPSIASPRIHAHDSVLPLTPARRGGWSYNGYVPWTNSFPSGHNKKLRLRGGVSMRRKLLVALVVFAFAALLGFFALQRGKVGRVGQHGGEA